MRALGRLTEDIPVPESDDDDLLEEGEARGEPAPKSSPADVARRDIDIVGVAPTGSGKTLAFLLPMLVSGQGELPRKVRAGGVSGARLRAFRAAGRRGRDMSVAGCFNAIATDKTAHIHSIAVVAQSAAGAGNTYALYNLLCTLKRAHPPLVDTIGCSKPNHTHRRRHGQGIYEYFGHA